MIIRPSMFDTDEELRREIETLFGEIGPPSKRAWEEFYHCHSFGLVKKDQGASTNYYGKIDLEGPIRIVAATFALHCVEPEDSPLVRACLYGAILSKLDGYKKEDLSMHWRKPPETITDNDFDTTTTKYMTWFRIGAWHKPQNKDLMN